MLNTAIIDQIYVTRSSPKYLRAKTIIYLDPSNFFIKSYPKEIETSG